MGNRGQKRMEMAVDLPEDKRACSSLDFRPSTSNSSVQTHLNSTNSTPETHHNDMDTSSSASASSRSEEEPEKDSGYGSCDSDDGDPRHSGLREFQRRRSSGDIGKLRNILGNLSDEGDPSKQIVALTELCEVLSFGTEDSLSSMMADSLSPVLVKLARHESNPEIMLLAVRAITYLCDVFPRSSSVLVRHDAVPALCQRLMAIDYLDVAEQCLQALEKISQDQSHACLQAGAIMAVLTYIDFFATSVQRVALSTVVNICKKLPSDCPSTLVDAVPILCNLLQYEDRQLVESVAICLIKISAQLSQSTEMLDKLCKHGLIHQATHLINSNSRTTLSQPVYNGLIGLLVKVSSGSLVAFRTLYELNISSILKDLLSTYDLLHGMSSPRVVDGRPNQVHEVLKLLNELLPTSAGDQCTQLVLDKQSYLVYHSDLLQKFGMDILPMLVQVVNSGANIYVCYGCLSVIHKIVYLSKSDMLVELLKSANMPRFLAGVFTRKDHHVLILALEIAEMVLQKLSDTFLNSFVKEGGLFAINALLMPEKCSQLFPVFSGTQLWSSSSQRSSGREVLRCLCYAFDTGQSSTASGSGTCRHNKDSVHDLAQKIRTTYFSQGSEEGLTDILQKLKTISAALSDLMNMPASNDSPAQNEEKFYCILHEIMEMLNGTEPVSTFEFIESGIVKSLMNYLSNGLYNVELHGAYHNLSVVERRFVVLARLFLSPSNIISEDFPVSVLIQKLQSALSSLENFPVILSHSFRQRNSFATVPYGRCIAHPCLKVRFVKGDGETGLSDFSEDLVTVDPFYSLDVIEGYLWPKVSVKGSKDVELEDRAIDQTKSESLCLPSDAKSIQGESSGPMENESMCTDLPPVKHDTMLVEMQEDEANVLVLASEQAVSLKQSSPAETSFSQESCVDCNNDRACKLLFYIEGKKLDRTLTLYQAILQQQIKSDDEFISGTKLWSQVHTITYRRAVESLRDDPQNCLHLGQKFTLLDGVKEHMEFASLFSSMFSCKLASDLDKSSPIYDILYLLKSLEVVNRFTYHLMSHERISAFTEGRLDNLDDLKVGVRLLHQNEFVSTKLTEKLEQQMRDSSTVSIGGMPSWCNQLMASCPFLFSFEAKCKYFQLAAFGPRQVQPHPPYNNSVVPSERRQAAGGLPRKKFSVCRKQILDSAAQMMDQYANHKTLLEVEYDDEVGTGLGPTLEFYTLVSHEFQKSGLAMWRDDHSSLATRNSLQVEDFEIVKSPFGLFPRPWSSAVDTLDVIQFSDVLRKFVLLGQVVAKALQDGRVLDLPFSRAFYKLILGKELSLYDIQSFDPELGSTLLEFQAFVNRKKYSESISGENATSDLDSCFRGTRVEDLYLDFTLPGYPEYVLASEADKKMVNKTNLGDYAALVVDATIGSGISRQFEAFKSGFCQVFPLEHLQIFTEEELERLLCGERDFLAFNEVLDHIKFDHGYTASSPPVVNLLEIIKEFDYKQRRAFLQFVTGAPRLPPGGLASLNPKLTIVRKHCGNSADAGLPSVMTCANYLKLPPYSSKERMKEKLLYAITEGQGSFHLS
ncbi:E3 ubiquitin-protein ligase UPL4 isoform X2 [Mangifera indica]|uniref:E3 ubiquitin-protein ligase UPL4 isoform X2 n=1 Tax=Mangifera indica TaxID=29780 RepID=UPI001CF9E3F6|nr:E3 ubiquitin-protein ligase UPL4 isoform X2 [Mangifera indica]